MANQGWRVPGWLPIDPLNASSLTPASIQLDSTSFSPADYEETQVGIYFSWKDKICCRKMEVGGEEDLGNLDF